ncbi:MAG: FecR family protein [Planctomycetaceae bacterium]|nr:FecR family protein [Planctomycetaceae bacterium]
MTNNHDSVRLRTLTNAVLDETAGPAELDELTNILRASEAARDEYLTLVDLHAVLATDPTLTDLKPLSSPASPAADPAAQSGDFAAEPHEAGRKPSDRQRGNKAASSNAALNRPGRRAALLTAVAACVLMVVRVLWPVGQTPSGGIGSPPKAPLGFAVVAQASDVVWSDQAFDAGTRLDSQTIVFQSGVLRLVFDDGVEVTLEGPAEYELVKPGSTRLVSGVLAATVPAGAEGFTVATPTAEVVDLGTSFGIDLRESGFSSVSVFDGEVEVAALDSTEKRLLTEGQSVKISADQSISDTQFDVDRFERLWPVASGITGSSDVFRFVPPWPKQIRFVHSDRHVFVAAEGRAVDLVQPLDVNISAPGDYSRVQQLTPITLSPEQRIRSYVLHYMPRSQSRPRRAGRVEGSITFDRPIAGLIVLHEELFASSRRFSRRPAGERQQRRQLDLTGDDFGDRITLSEDRRTLTVSFVSPGRSSDLVRVIVEADEPER